MINPELYCEDDEVENISNILKKRNVYGGIYRSDVARWIGRDIWMMLDNKKKDELVRLFDGLAKERVMACKGKKKKGKKK